MSEIYNCFKYLLDSSPQWVRDVEELERTIAERQNEMVRSPVPVSPTPKKTASNESLRDGSPLQPERHGYNNPNGGSRMEVNSNPEAAHNHEGHVRAFDAMHMLLSQRKRKTTSVLSNNTAPIKFRSRSMIIVYYDSRVQASFEHLVRSIGTGRNSIRKARMAARMEALSAGEDDPDDFTREIPSFRSTRKMGMSPKASGSKNGAQATEQALAEADEALERAQRFCETGAHQFLRDGECQEETEGTKTSFRELHSIAEKELARQNLRQQQQEQNAEEDRRNAAIATAQQMSVPAFSTALATQALEADDGEDNGEFDIGSVSLPPFRRAMART
jgi:hypothetical protein